MNSAKKRASPMAVIGILACFCAVMLVLFGQGQSTGYGALDDVVRVLVAIGTVTVCIFAASILAGAVHGLGQVIAARLVGYRLEVFSLWPVMWMRSRTPRLQWDRETKTGYMVNVWAYPLEGEAPTPKKKETFIIGGIVADALHLGFWLWMGGQFHPFIGFFAIPPGVMFCSALFNNKTGDGWHLAELRRNPQNEMAAAAATQVRWLGQMTGRPIPESVIDLALTYTGNLSWELWNRQMALHLAKERGRRLRLIEDFLPFLEEKRPANATAPHFAELAIMVSHHALFTFYDAATARRAIPAEEMVPEECLRNYLAVLAGLEAAEGSENAEITLGRAAELLDRDEQSRLNDWVKVDAPLISFSPTILRQIQFGCRPRDLDSDAFRRLKALKVGPDACAFAFDWLAAHHLDSGSDADASRVIKEALDLVESGQVSIQWVADDIHIEAAHIAALIDRNLDEAERILPKASPSKDLELYWLRASAAMDMLRGQPEEAEAKLQRAESLLKPSHGEKADFERSLYARIRTLKPLA